MDKVFEGFSVLITVYDKDNNEYFEEALKSITIDQVLKPDEIVLVVDGPVSKEKITIIKKFSDMFNFKVIKLEKNIGQGMALNEGLKNCTYEYIARMDSDDISMSNRFLDQVEFLKNNPDVDILSSWIIEIDIKNNELIKKLPLSHYELVGYSKLRSPINHGVCFYKKSKVLDAGGYNDFVQMQDYYLFVKMICAGSKIANIDSLHLKARVYDHYARKSGLSYMREEFFLALTLLKIKHLNAFQFIKFLMVRIPPRMLGKRVVLFLYKYYIRTN